MPGWSATADPVQFCKGRHLLGSSSFHVGSSCREANIADFFAPHKHFPELYICAWKGTHPPTSSQQGICRNLCNISAPVCIEVRTRVFHWELQPRQSSSHDFESGSCRHVTKAFLHLLGLNEIILVQNTFGRFKTAPRRSYFDTGAFGENNSGRRFFKAGNNDRKTWSFFLCQPLNSTLYESIHKLATGSGTAKDVSGMRRWNQWQLVAGNDDSRESLAENEGGRRLFTKNEDLWMVDSGNESQRTRFLLWRNLGAILYHLTGELAAYKWCRRRHKK
ncbi:hypothetical protein B0H19DRAFT_1065417 [Mycena capillaripes]|nr:hypothetical protein B0H19DRAFT_1065417 [Mycena capillaripes]